MFDKLIAAFTSHNPADMAQQQREALIDLLVLVMFVDGHIALAESDELAAATKSMAWEGITPVQTYINEAVVKVRGLADDDAQVQFLIEISSRMETDAVRISAYTAARQLAMSDDEAAAEETDLLKRIKVAFAIA